jgi:hypothetical protein
LLANDELVKLLYYTNIDPLAQTSLSEEDKKTKIFNDLICIIPNVGTREDSKAVIAVYIPKASGLSGNSEYKTVTIAIDIFVPMT